MLIYITLSKSNFICSQCGEGYTKWTGRCYKCKAWDSLEEVSSSPGSLDNRKDPLVLKTLDQIEISSYHKLKSISEFDQVCGDGLTPKSVILIVGEPGIGKSTLLLQICHEIKSDRLRVYITGEEAVEQVKARAERLRLTDVDSIEIKNADRGIEKRSKIDEVGMSSNSCRTVSTKKNSAGGSDQALKDRMSLVCCASVMCVETIISTLEKYNPCLVVIDSIQTLYSETSDNAPGTVVQMRLCTHLLIQWAKKSNSILIMVGHVTKEGTIAGPRVVEHMVDTVLYFEGERGGQPIRFLRTVKNRFGPTEVTGVFEIRNEGLMPFADVSKIFVNQQSENTWGTSVMPSMDGNRCILVRMEALVSNSYLPSPRRSVVGWDISRLHMICAILESKCKLSLGNKDIYFNIVGGIKILEPASDLAAAIAIMSSVMKVPVPAYVSSFGELSLSGEIKSVKNMDARVAESVRMGFGTVCVPASYERKGKVMTKKVMGQQVGNIGQDDSQRSKTDMDAVIDDIFGQTAADVATEDKKKEPQLLKFYNISQVHEWLRSMG